MIPEQKRNTAQSDSPNRNEFFNLKSEMRILKFKISNLKFEMYDQSPLPQRVPHITIDAQKRMSPIAPQQTRALYRIPQ